MGITRRQFLGGALALGGGLAAGSVKPVLRGLGYANEAQAAAAMEERVFRTACNIEGNHCGYLVHVRNGRAVQIKPDPNFYLRPCLRGYSRLQWTYHPNRIKYPFKRVGERGENKWQRIVWEEALDTIAQRFGEMREQYGPESVLFIGGTVLSSLRYLGLNRFANAFGQGEMTQILGDLCCSAQAEGEMATLGYRVNVWEGIPASRFIIHWGHNPAQTYHAHWYLFEEAVEAGARMVTIDPRFSETAAKSDQWLAPLPGTDLAMIMGMIHVIIAEMLYDRDFVLTRTNLPFLINENTGQLLTAAEAGISPDKSNAVVWCSLNNAPVAPGSTQTPVLEGSFTVNGIPVRTVFSRLKQQVSRYDAAKITEITGVSGEDVQDLARAYATTKPALINSVMSGAQRTSYGEYFVAGLVYLAALTGNLGLYGGGINDIGGPMLHGNDNTAAMLYPYSPYIKGSIPVTKLGEHLFEGKPYPIKGILWQGRGLGQNPNSLKLLEGMKKTEFIVVQDHFLNDAATIADILLPAATLLEYTDLMPSHVNNYYQLIDQAVEPLWESKSDMWILSELAKRLGFGEDFDKTDEQWVDYLLEPTGLTAKDLREKGPVWCWGDAKLNRFGVKSTKETFAVFKDTPFLTASGRVEFHASRWEKMGFAAMADYFPAEEGPEKTPALAQKYPLSLVAAKIRTKIHSSYALMPWLSEIYPKGWVEMNVSDAYARGISEGDMVDIYNDRGKLTLTARVHAGIRPGVIMLQDGWWIQQGANASVLTNDAPSAINFGHTLNSTLVQVRRVPDANT